MDAKNIIIIILICAIVVLSAYVVAVNLGMNHNQTDHPVNTTNNTTDVVNVEKISQEDQSSSSSASSGSGKATNDKYIRDSNGNIMYAHTDAPGEDGSFSVPMTKDGHYSYKATDEPNSPSGYWVDKT